VPTDATAQSALPPAELSRADARRNRARVLAAAQAAFAVEGTGVSLSAIARRAGVGAGTVYRHFPTKEGLLEAVMSQRLERMTRLATQHAASDRPGAAFAEFVTEVVLSTPTDRGMCELLEGTDSWPHVVLQVSGRRFREALATLLHAAREAGAVRPNLGVEDVLAVFTGCVAMQRAHANPRELAPMSALLIGALTAAGPAVTDREAAPKIRYGTPGSGEKRHADGAARPVCGSCGSPLTRAGSGRPARFCSPACRQRAYRRRRSATR
jgi:AcrR family transcriptional regulator